MDSAIAGHNAWIDDPETVLAELERFLTTERRSGIEAGVVTVAIDMPLTERA